MIGDYAGNQIPQRHPWVNPHIVPQPLSPAPYYQIIPPSRAEFDALKKDIEELKKLITAAKKFDEATDQPHCEHAEKVALLKRLAALVGVELDIN